MFYKVRAVDVPDGLPKWSGMAYQSSLGWDSPPDAAESKDPGKDTSGETEPKELKN